MHELTARLIGQERSRAAEAALDLESHLAAGATLAFRVAYGVLRHHQDAEDIAQEACVRACRKLGQLRDPQKFRGWLVRMAWRLALDYRRGQLRRAAREAVSDQLPTPVLQDSVAIQRERHSKLWAAIDGLPDRLRQVVVLAAINEHGLSEVASLLGLPEGTVKSRLFEARRILKGRLPDEPR